MILNGPAVGVCAVALLACAGIVGGLIVTAKKSTERVRTENASDLFHRKFMQQGWLIQARMLRAFVDKDGVGLQRAESQFAGMNPYEILVKPVQSHRPGVPQPPPAATGIRPATYGTPRRG